MRLTRRDLTATAMAIACASVRAASRAWSSTPETCRLS